jgi:hypothetical protein
MADEIIVSGQKQGMTFQDIMQAATMVAECKLFSGYDTPAKVATLMMLAQAEGRHPIEAMQRYDIIQGKPAKKPQAMLDDFIRGGGRVEWLQTTPEIAEAVFTPFGGKPLTMSFTMKQAAVAGLTGKATWKQYPENMLRARLISNAMRMIAPSATAGLYSPEEVVDMSDTRQEVKQEAKAVDTVTGEVIHTDHISEVSKKVVPTSEVEGVAPRDWVAKIYKIGQECGMSPDEVQMLSRTEMNADVERLTRGDCTVLAAKIRDRKQPVSMTMDQVIEEVKKEEEKNV